MRLLRLAVIIMSRILFYMLVATPLIVIGITARIVATCRAAQLVALAVILWTLTGCAAIIDRDIRSCYNEAWTIKAAEQCRTDYPQHLGTLSDTIAQPIGTLERAIQHRGHPHE